MAGVQLAEIRPREIQLRFLRFSEGAGGERVAGEANSQALAN